LLAYTHDEATRSAALEALAAHPVADPLVAAAWASLAADHPDPKVAERAQRALGQAKMALAPIDTNRGAPRITRSLVTSLDGHGRGYIVLAAENRGDRAVAAFLCDVLQGIPEVIGQLGCESSEGFLRAFAARPERDVVEDVSELALGLLAGSLLLCGPGTTPALRYWLERTVGGPFRPRPFPGLLADFDPASVPFAEISDRAAAVLDACPAWVDDSELTYELAEEILLREENIPPDPRHHSGAFRFLFDHRLMGRLELYRRMLFWMASFWEASGAPDLARSALALAWQLSDAQHAVPGHPFIAGLIARSLAAAQADLRLGLDPRSPRSRALRADLEEC
ncbi:MAG: hypothetical protein IRY99_04615, partial [Isosphaeraceae bacterium]|nr:hypothetical protein [Isosphaeraceae bacterium]